MYDDMTYSMLVEMVVKKFKLDPNDRLNLSVKLHSFDSRLDITDDDENESGYKNEPNFIKPGSSFAFGSYDENEDEQNDCFDGVDENPQPVNHKWKNFMSFIPDFPETPLYMSKPMISKHYNKDLKVKIGQTFLNKEALDLVSRLKVIEDGYQFLAKKSNPDRKNPGTVTRVKTNEEGVFEMLFIAIGASIRIFVNHLRPLLNIYASHLKGMYKGTNLLALGMDGNNYIVPIAFGICKGETGPCWS
ncbi:hypothetical protein Tco_0341276 [Tanacetum coccineum]